MTAPLYGPTAEPARTPPNGSIYVDPAIGDDHADGTSQSPLATPAVALDRAPVGGTVVLRPHPVHPYRVSLDQPWHKPIVLQNEPGETVTLSGANAAPRRFWSQDGELWHLPYRTPDHTPASEATQPEGKPWVCWPEMMWQQGRRYRMVAPDQRPGPDEFRVDVPNQRLTVSVEPDDTTEVAVRPYGIKGSPDTQLGVFGLRLFGYATPPRQYAALTMFGEGSWIDSSAVLDCAQAGISARGDHQQIVYTAARGCGQLGVHSWRTRNLYLLGLFVTGNNSKGFVSSQQAGGLKVVECLGVTLEQSLARGNDGHNWWFDVDSNGAVVTRCIGDAGHSGFFFEISRDGVFTGNLATNNWIGIYLAGSTGTLVAHNTCRLNGEDIVNRGDGRMPRADPATNTLIANDPGGVAAPASDLEADILNLPAAEAAVPVLGWYGPIYTPPTTPEDPVPYDPTPAVNAMLAASDAMDDLIEEIQRLEAIIANDPDQATIAELQARITKLEDDLHKTAVALMARTQENSELIRTNATLAAEHASMRATVDQLVEERDQALTRSVEAEELLGEAQATILDLQQQLADCQAGQEPEPANPIWVGGSHPQGYSALKELCGPVPAQVWRRFEGDARIDSEDIPALNVAVNDGVIPLLSVTFPASTADTQWNIDLLKDHGLDQVPGAVIIAHEPTNPGKGLTGPQFKAMVTEHYALLRDQLPLWKRIVCGMRRDFTADAADPVWFGHWLPDDLELVTDLGVDVYDKHPTNAQTFAELMADVEAFAAWYGDKKLWICEMSAPDVGQYGRAEGWKAQWLRDAWTYAKQAQRLDGSRRYGALVVFNGTGPDAPPAVTLPDGREIPAGWGWGSTPQARGALIEVLTEAANQV